MWYMRMPISFTAHKMFVLGESGMRGSEEDILRVPRTSTWLAILFWSCRLKEGIAPRASTAAWWRQSHAALGNCALSASLPQNFCAVLGKFLKPTLSEVMTDWVFLVLHMCGWFRVWCEGVPSSHSCSWGNAYCALETESRVLNKLRNQVLGSTQK